MSVRILVMGLPGSGKSYLAQRLKDYIETRSDFSTMPTEKLLNYESPPLFSIVENGSVCSSL
jgi:adenylate kinase family enzyme